MPGLRVLTIYQLNTPQKQIEAEMFQQIHRKHYVRKKTIIYNKNVAN